MGESEGAATINGSNGKEEWKANGSGSRATGPGSLTRIKVVGVGDGGCSWVVQMPQHDVRGVDYVLANTEVRRPSGVNSNGVVKMAEIVEIGRRAAYAWPRGRYSALKDLAVEDSDLELRRALENAELVLLTAGMGGSTGTVAAPYVGTLAREMGAFVLGVVTTPFSFEGRRRIGEAIAGVDRLRLSVDSLIVIHSDRLLRYVGPDASIVEVFSKADDVITRGILAVAELLNQREQGGLRFADVRNVLAYPGGALMAVGLGRGVEGVEEAAREALAYPLVNISIAGAQGLLASVKGGPGLVPARVNTVGSLLAGSLRRKPRVILGTTIDQSLEDQVQVTLLATGL